MKKISIKEDRGAFDSNVDRRIEQFADYFDKPEGRASVDTMIDNLFSSAHIGTAMLLRDEMREMDVNLKADIAALVHSLTCATANVKMLFVYASEMDGRGELFAPVNRYMRYACIEGLHEANDIDKRLREIGQKAINLYDPKLKRKQA